VENAIKRFRIKMFKANKFYNWKYNYNWSWIRLQTWSCVPMLSTPFQKPLWKFQRPCRQNKSKKEQSWFTKAIFSTV